MGRLIGGLIWLVLAAAASSSSAVAETTTQTLLFVRHAEKPAAGLGQLSCKGLNRALALADVIRRKYGHLDAVFAPDPSTRKPDNDKGDAFDYVRPLATVEPTAVAFGLPVRASLGYNQVDQLTAALLAPAYRNAIVLVGWEHHSLNKMVPKLIAALGGDASTVPEWARTDFDSIWRMTIERDGSTTKVAFALDKEGLDGQPDTCPK